MGCCMGDNDTIQDDMPVINNDRDQIYRLPKKREVTKKLKSIRRKTQYSFIEEVDTVQKQTVAVTAGSGFIASWIVKTLLERGHNVRTTVRNINDKYKYHHLLQLKGAKNRLKIFEADLMKPGSFRECLTGCDGVIHTATPISFGEHIDGERDILEPAIQGLKDIMNTCVQEKSIKAFVWTSSMVAMQPKPLPEILSEKHWSDPHKQKEEAQQKGNDAYSWYFYTKTIQELTAKEFFKGNTHIRYVSMNPAMVIGPMLQQNRINDTMLIALQMMNGEMMGGEDGPSSYNDQLFVCDVRDVASLHVSAYENQSAKGRYMCCAGSQHVNDVYTLLMELNDGLQVKMYDGEDKVTPFKPNFIRQNTLGIKVRSFETTWRETFEWCKQNGHIK